MKRLNIRNIALSLILIFSLAGSSNCGLLPDIITSPPSSPPATADTANGSPESTASNATEEAIDSEWSIPLGKAQAPILPSIADVVARVKPSVVAINTEFVTSDILRGQFTQEGAGSGWIIREDGIIITNNHVIEGAKSITVILDDGRIFPVAVKRAASDRLTDLAVLKIEAENLPVIPVGDSQKLRIGDWVVAIGNPLGQGLSATKGIVSSLGVSLSVSRGQTLYNLVQTDAAINPGNSGGPLVNMAGEVIGITSIKIAQVGVEGMGYAISTNEAIPIIEQLIKTGYVVRPWLGVTLDNASRYNLTVDKGALIVNMASASPAEEAGLRVGDVITKFGDREITEVTELIRAIHESQVGQRVAINFWRANSQKTTYATLIESPPPP